MAMASEILRPQDCLRPNQFYDPFSTPKPFPNRRRLRTVRTNQTTPSPNPKHVRPNPKSNRKSSPPSRSSSPPSTSPTSASALSTSPVKDGFRLLRRGEAFQPGKTGSEKKLPVEIKQLGKKRESGLARPELEASPIDKVPFLHRSEPPLLPARVERTPPKKKNQSDRTRPDLATPPANPVQFGSDKESGFAGPNFAVRAPEASCLPQPGFLLRTSSADPTNHDEASRALRSLLKLQFK